MTTTSETVHGLLRLEQSELVIQWRVARKTEHFGGTSMRTDEEVESVEETRVPLASVAGADVRRGFWWWMLGPRVTLNASDLLAFEDLAGENGLQLSHPAEFVLRIRRSDILAAEEFAAELALAIAQRSLQEAEAAEPLPRAETPRELTEGEGSS